MATKKKSIKEKVKAKAKAVKAKVKGKCKGGKCAAIAFLLLSACIVGCQTPEQASRSTKAEVGDVEPSVKIEFGKGCASNSVSVVIHNTFGDGAIASADSSGSTESQTQTPTFDIKPDLDVHYNDAVGKGGDAMSGIINLLTPAAKALLQKAIAEKQTGTLTLEKTDGGTVQVECKDGVCSPCEGGACSPSSAK